MILNWFVIIFVLLFLLTRSKFELGHAIIEWTTNDH